MTQHAAVLDWCQEKIAERMLLLQLCMSGKVTASCCLPAAAGVEVRGRVSALAGGLRLAEPAWTAAGLQADALMHLTGCQRCHGL